MQRLWLLAIAIGTIGCSKKDDPHGDRAVARPVEPAVAKADPCAQAKAEGAEVMPWIQDDLPAALACGKQRGVPVVVDEWAPWCHTCLSMQSTVFTDPSFAPDVKRFVFVALDTDKDVNADAVAKYPPSAWPTFYVIGEDKAAGKPEAVLARFVGAASVAQFHAFLDAGAKAQAGGAAGADAHLLGAERALAIKDLATAEQELTAALAQAPADWVRRPDALTSLIQTKRRREDIAGCLTVAEQAMDQTGNAAAATDFIVNAMMCADAKKDDKALAPRIQKLRERTVDRLVKLVADQGAPLSIDDRSDAMVNLREQLDALGRTADAKATAEQQRKMLDEAAAKAPTPMAAMTYNWQRCEVYVYLGVPLEMVPALEKSVADLPREYDPRARLGWIYLKAGKAAEAAKWTDEALGLVYGPRKARVLAQRAEIAQLAKDPAAERKAREQIVKLWETMPAGQASPEALTKAREQLAAMDAPTAK